MDSDALSVLQNLYVTQLQKRHTRYLELHSQNTAVLRRHIQAFELYQPFITGGKVLDWGCNHAVDSCLLKMAFGDAVDLHGCDVGETPYETFFDFANLHYTHLTHPYRLPYDDEEFDTIISSGVLEHVPNDGESLKELYRILKPDGIFIVTFLPNALSWTEFLSRCLSRTHHLRRYRLRQLENLLLHKGFIIKKIGYHQFLPTLSSGNVETRSLSRFAEVAYPTDRILSHLPGLRNFCANLYAISRKAVSI